MAGKSVKASADVPNEARPTKERESPANSVVSPQPVVPPAPAQVTVEPDKTGLLVDDFFNSNVKLLEQCA